jgi:hypothetical protein
MTGTEPSGAEPHVLEIFDEQADGSLACRVCGAVVLAEGGYPRTHWDWHEASNGA